jgi:hypothetical protein
MSLTAACFVGAELVIYFVLVVTYSNDLTTLEYTGFVVEELDAGADDDVMDDYKDMHRKDERSHCQQNCLLYYLLAYLDRLSCLDLATYGATPSNDLSPSSVVRHTPPTLPLPLRYWLIYPPTLYIYLNKR